MKQRKTSCLSSFRRTSKRRSASENLRQGSGKQPVVAADVPSGAAPSFCVNRPWHVKKTAIPPAQIRSRIVGRLEEIEDQLVGIRRRPHAFIRQNELAKLGY